MGGLPEPDELRRRCQVLATLKILTEGREEDTWHGDVTFQPQWRPGEDLAIRETSNGDGWSILFCGSGTFLRGANNEEATNRFGTGEGLWPGMTDGMPERFLRALEDPDFYTGHYKEPYATVCIWRTPEDDQWQQGELASDENGEEPYGGESGIFMDILDEHWSSEWIAGEIYSPVDHEIPDGAVERVMRFEPITDELIGQFHPEPDFAWVRSEAEKIGYPVSA